MFCTICRAPWHPASGHWESERRHWCSACCRAFIRLYRDMAPRRWGSMRFYDFATVPQGDTSKQDLEKQ